jgi:catechol 2,3-dioxygenase-like lactoylglutathione lyase family enzyme
MSIQVSGVCALLQVFDMPTSVRFYRDVLGFEIVERSEGNGDQFDWGLLRLNDAEVMLNTAYERDSRPPAADRARIEAHTDTCLYFGCGNVDAAYQHLKSRGIAVEQPKVAPYGMKQLYVRDPDGYMLCFQWPEQRAGSEDRDPAG